MDRLRKQAGQTLVEVLIAIALSSIMLPTLAGALVTSRYARPAALQQLQADGLLREGEEAVRSVREKGWTAFAVDGTYYPAISGSAWTLTSGSQTVNGFTRSVAISDVQRNSSGAIVSSGGTVDPSTKLATITVSWATPYSDSISGQMYVTRWQNNTTWVQNTQAAFNGGTLSNTVTTATGGGQVQLAPGTYNWATPSVAGTYNGSAASTAVYVDSSTNRAYEAVGTALKIINVATPTAPALLGSYTAAGTIKGIYASGNFVYLATTSVTGQLIVVNVTTPSSPTTAATKAVGGTAASSIAGSGSTVYLGVVPGGSTQFYVISVATPTAPSISGSVAIAGTISGIAISGTMAYLATNISTKQLEAVSVATPTAPSVSGSFDPAGTVAANAVAVSGTTVYLGEATNASGSEFYVINAAIPSSMSTVGSYKVNANVNGLAVSGANVFLATALASQQFMVLSVATPSTPSLVGSSSLSTENGISFLGNYAYLASSSTTQTLTVMQGTTPTYQSSGTFTSSSLNAGATAGFNYFTFTDTVPTNTTLQFQIAENTDNSTWNYVGPDGTAGSFYTTGQAVPINSASGQYFRYKATLTGNGSVTPVIQSTTLNYSL